MPSFPRTFNESQQLRLRLESESLARYKAQMVQRTVNLTDAEAECPHGKLPLDRVQTCSCWPPEAREALAIRVQDSPDFCQG